MQEKSLNQIMNEMASRLETIRPNEPQLRSSQVLSELDAFIEIDNVLASLNKQYLEAKQQRKELVALNGVDDAMAEIAIDMEDSAWCAMQTRYIELRQEKELMQQAQRKMRLAEELVVLESQKEKEKEFKKFLSSLKIIEQLRAKERRFNIGAFEAVFIMMIFKMFPILPMSQSNQRALVA